MKIFLVNNKLSLYLQCTIKGGDMPNVYILAGCNGAGKTTVSYTVLPDLLDCRELVNADEIAKGLSPFNPESVSIDAGRIMLLRIEGLLNNEVDFGFETTLATRSYVNFIKKAQRKGYFVSLLFFWLPTVEQAIQRVAMRVSEGGHSIPDDVIRRRYVAGLHNLQSLYFPICDFWTIYDNSSVDGIKRIACGAKNKPTEIFDVQSYEKIKSYE